jgi:two-component system cell cycle sensor histidine kinase/response regulator CckA
MYQDTGNSILIVNDDVDQLLLMKFELEKEGYQILTAVNGVKGLEMAMSEYPDLIISDVMMPDISGIEMCRQIRATPDLYNTPVLLVSAMCFDNATVVEGLLMGADDYLEIPYDPPRLIAKVSRIIERKRDEDTRLSFLVDSSGDAIIGKTLDGIITSWNASAEKMYGYSAAEAIGRHISFINPPESKDELAEILERVKYGEAVQNLQLVRIRKDGARVFVSISISPIRGTRGQIIGISSIARDITESRQLEERLRQSQRLEAVGKLAGGIAHDFNNLLTVIGGHSQLVLMKLHHEDPVWENIEEIKKASDRAATLTRQLLAFSRKQVLQPKVLALNSLIIDVEKMLRRVIGEDIQLRTYLAPELGQVKCDPGQIEQVLMNLAINARDAMLDGGKLTIETRNAILDETSYDKSFHIEPGRYIEVCVKDTGTGMDEETQKHIFEPFFTTKEAGKGTGLGLSTVYGIVKQSGGYIWADTELRRGTTFKVYLPRVDEDVQEYKPVAAPQLRLQGRETVLLAEDDENVRRLVRDLLKHNGYQVLEAADGNLALLICEQYEEAIHLMITDVVMPSMNGRELTRRLADLRPEMKVLFMSGYTDDTIMRHGVVESDITFLQKPFAPATLMSKMREVLETNV